MDLVTIIKAILPVEPVRPKPDGSLLKPGDRLEGKVLNVHKNGNVTMDFNSFRAITQVPMPVQMGQTFSLEVVHTGDPLKMRILPAGASVSDDTGAGDMAKQSDALSQRVLPHLRADLSILENQLSSPGTPHFPKAIQSALATLKALFTSLDLRSDPTALAGAIHKLVEQSGLFFEKNLAAALAPALKSPAKIKTDPHQMQANTVIQSDAKSSSLLLLNYLAKMAVDHDPEAATVKDRIRAGLKAILTDLSQQKELAVKRLSADDPLQVFQVALPFSENEATGKLKLYYTKREKKGQDGPPRVSLLLDLDNLGLIRSDFLMVQNDLSVSFYVSNAEIKAQVDTRLGDIRAVLENLFDTIALSVTVSQQKIEAVHLPPSIDDHDHKIDLRI